VRHFKSHKNHFAHEFPLSATVGNGVFGSYTIEKQQQSSYFNPASSRDLFEGDGGAGALQQLPWVVSCCRSSVWSFGSSHLDAGVVVANTIDGDGADFSLPSFSLLCCWREACGTIGDSYYTNSSNAKKLDFKLVSFPSEVIIVFAFLALKTRECRVQQHSVRIRHPNKKGNCKIAPCDCLGQNKILGTFRVYSP
jgi:hypothetical protein